MKTLALAVAAALTVITPAAFAQYDRDRSYDPSAYPDNPPDHPEWRYQDRRDDDASRRSYRADTHARVVQSTPVYAQGGSHEECWNEETHHYEHSRAAGTILGAIAGGVIGHQFGSSSGGRDRGTAAGAIVGGIAGNQIARHHDESEPSNEQRCRTVTDSGSDVVAYDVRYEYHGREFTTRLDHDPGRWLDVGRDIRADGYPLDSDVATDPAPSQPYYDRDSR